VQAAFAARLRRVTSRSPPYLLPLGKQFFRWLTLRDSPLTLYVHNRTEPYRASRVARVMVFSSPLRQGRASFLERLGKMLHTHYDEVLNEPLAQRWVDLINYLKPRRGTSLRPITKVRHKSDYRAHTDIPAADPQSARNRRPRLFTK
jgi:hypothetical protein